MSDSRDEAALEEVVECIINFGCYPQPRRVGTFITSGSNKPKQFDLYDFLCDKGTPEFSDLLEYFILSMNDWSRAGPFEGQRSRWLHRVETMLTAHLKDSGIVQDRAAVLRAEEKESA